MSTPVAIVAQFSKRFSPEIGARADKILARLQKDDSDHLTRKRQNYAEQQTLKAALNDAMTRANYYRANAGKMYRLEHKDFTAPDINNISFQIMEKNPEPAVKQVEAEVKLLRQRLAAVQAAVQADVPRLTGGRFLKAIERIPPKAVITDAPIEMELPSDQTDDEALAVTRETIAGTIDERALILEKPRTKAEMLAAAAAQVKALAGRGVPKVRTLRADGKIEFPGTSVADNLGHARRHIPDGVALLAYLFEDELMAKIEQLIAINSDDANAMKAAAQKTALAKIDAALERLRRQEAALVESIIADGGNAYHFADAPIDAVLGISIT